MASANTMLALVSCGQKWGAPEMTSQFLVARIDMQENHPVIKINVT